VGKKFMLIGLMTLFAMGIIACSSKDSVVEDEGVTKAMSVASKYKKEELEAVSPSNSNEIALQETVKKKAVINLTTRDFFNKQSANGMYERSLRVALVKNNDLKITYISFTEQSVTEEDIELTYTGTLRLGEEAKDKLFLNGTVSLLKEDGVWKVDNDIYNSEDIYNMIDNGESGTEK
jgi:hypothetical protein